MKLALRPVPLLLLAVVAAVATSCSHPGADLAPKTRESESASLADSSQEPGGVSLDRQAFDPKGIGWVTAFRVEATDAEKGGKAEAEFYRADLELENQATLLVATAQTPELRFPAGFGLPLEQIVHDVPEGWRGAAVVSAARSGTGRALKLHTTFEFLTAAPNEEEPNAKRLYALTLPLTDENADDAATAGAAPRFQVPPGSKVTRKKYMYVVPVDSTVHYGIAELSDFAKYVRLSDATEGKLLWEATPVPRPGTSHLAGIPAYSSATGFPLYRDHEYEIEALYENTSPAPIDALAVLHLYYRPPGSAGFSYPVPPAEGDAAH